MIIADYHNNEEECLILEHSKYHIAWKDVNGLGLVSGWTKL